MQTWTFEAIGTRWDITHPLTGEDEARVRSAIEQRIEEFDKNYSRFRGDSLIAKIARDAGSFEMPTDFAPLFALYKKLFEITRGLFTPCIGGVLEDLGYDKTYSFTSRVSRPLVDFARISFDGRVLHTEEPVLLDFGAGGKGYLIDIIADMLAKECTAFAVNAGGDIRVHGIPKFRVGLEDPQATENALGVLEIENESICGSAGNRRAWGNNHHIVNPVTHQSPKDILATWVVARNTMEADALSTALFFLSPAVLTEDFTFDWALLSNDRSVRFSDRCKGVFF